MRGLPSCTHPWQAQLVAKQKEEERQRAAEDEKSAAQNLLLNRGGSGKAPKRAKLSFGFGPKK